jgi:hypothetical protein
MKQSASRAEKLRLQIAQAHPRGSERQEIVADENHFDPS